MTLCINLRNQNKKSMIVDSQSTEQNRKKAPQLYEDTVGNCLYEKDYIPCIYLRTLNHISSNIARES